MIKDSEVFRIGTITKPHGVNGEVVFQFTDDIFDRVECDYLICKLDGILVPFFMEEYRFKSDTSALVKFERMDTAESTLRLQGAEVYFPLALAEQDENGELSWSYFVGMTAFDEEAGELGTVVEVNNQTVNTLFVIDGKNGELLIPAQEEFIVEIDKENRHLYFNLPEGMLDL